MSFVGADLSTHFVGRIVNVISRERVIGRGRSRLTTDAAALDDERSHLLREIGMTDKCDSKVGVHAPQGSLSQCDDVDLIEGCNQRRAIASILAASSGRRTFGRAAT
jgi:hypothetical protein